MKVQTTVACQLSIFIKLIEYNFNVTELLDLKSMSGRTTGKDLFLSACPVRGRHRG